MNREDYYVVPDVVSDNDLREAAYCLMKDASCFMGDLLERLADAVNALQYISNGLDRIAEAMPKSDFAGALQDCIAVLQKKEASSSSPLSSPLKEGEESSTEEEETHPPIVPPSSPEENCTHNSAREALQNDALQEECSKRDLEELEESFGWFWDAYGYKRNRKEAWTAWKRLSQRDREAAMAGVAAYKDDCERFQRQMAHASTYIHQRRWEDDFNSGLENADRINGRSRLYTREDIRNIEQQQRLEGVARVAAEFRAGLV